MPGHHSVPKSGRHRITRKMPVAPKGQPAPRFRSIAKHPANRLRAPIDLSIGFDQADRRLKTFDRNVRAKAGSYRLERSDINSTARRFLPPADPAEAKVTVSVIDQERPLGGGRAMNEAVRTLNRYRFRRLHCGRSEPQITQISQMIAALEICPGSALSSSQEFKQKQQFRAAF
jgi:hypothetical protein